MSDDCRCCCQCSSNIFGSKPFRPSFPKKLLVAISIVTLISMCLIPAESASIELHKMRHHRKQDSTAETKEIMRVPNSEDHRTRHMKRHPEKLTLLPKDSLHRPKKFQSDLFKNATRKIVKKLKNTRRFFKEERTIFNETLYKDGMPEWIPKVNFVEIHDHDFKVTKRSGVSISQRKFAYLMPKLYKSLRAYEEIFKVLLSKELDAPDDPTTVYKIKRQRTMKKILERLNSTIAEVTENMGDVNIELPSFNRSKLHLEVLERKVDAPQYLKNDYIACRGYGHLLDNWLTEFRCSKNKNSSLCRRYAAELHRKLIKRVKTIPRTRRSRKYIIATS